MKHILPILLLLSALTACNAPRKVSSENHRDKIFYGLRVEALSVMKEMGIEIRDSMHKDGPLKIEVVDFSKIPGLESRIGSFDRGNAGSVVNWYGKVVSYSTPTIHIAPFIDSVLLEKKDTSRFFELYARTTMVHEYVHLFQKNFKLYNARFKNLTAYEWYTLPNESEAYSAGAYYFLKNYNQNILSQYDKYRADPKKYRENLFRRVRYIYDLKSIELQKPL